MMTNELQYSIISLFWLSALLGSPFSSPTYAQLPPASPIPTRRPDPPPRDKKLLAIYGALPLPYQSPLNQRTYQIAEQGSTSNCDYIAVQNGVQNTGG